MASSYIPSDQERAFLEAVSAVFAEHPEGSARFGLCDVAKLTELFDRDPLEKFGLRRDDTGNVAAVPEDTFAGAADVDAIAPTFPASVQNPFAGPINPITGEPEGACLAVVPAPTGEGLGWECIIYLTA